MDSLHSRNLPLLDEIHRISLTLFSIHLGSMLRTSYDRDYHGRRAVIGETVNNFYITSRVVVMKVTSVCLSSCSDKMFRICKQVGVFLSPSATTRSICVNACLRVNQSDKERKEEASNENPAPTQLIKINRRYQGKTSTG